MKNDNTEQIPTILCFSKLYTCLKILTQPDTMLVFESNKRFKSTETVYAAQF